MRNVFSGLTHVIAVERIPQTVADHRIDVFHVAHFLALTQHRRVGGHGHVLLAAGDDDGRVTQHDVLCAEGHGAQAGATNLVNRPSGGFLRKACVDVGLTGGVLALRGGEDLAQNRLGHLGFIDASTLDNGLNRGFAQIVGGGVGERAEEAADRRTSGGSDDDIGHGKSFPVRNRVHVGVVGAVCVSAA